MTVSRSAIAAPVTQAKGRAGADVRGVIDAGGFDNRLLDVRQIGIECAADVVTKASNAVNTFDAPDACAAAFGLLEA